MLSPRWLTSLIVGLLASACAGDDPLDPAPPNMTGASASANTSASASASEGSESGGDELGSGDGALYDPCSLGECSTGLACVGGYCHEQCDLDDDCEGELLCISTGLSFEDLSLSVCRTPCTLFSPSCSLAGQGCNRKLDSADEVVSVCTTESEDASPPAGGADAPAGCERDEDCNAEALCAPSFSSDTKDVPGCLEAKCCAAVCSPANPASCLDGQSCLDIMLTEQVVGYCSVP